MSIRANSLPLCAFFVGLNLKPIIVLIFIGLNIANDSFKFLSKPFLPLGILGPSMNGEEWYFRSRFFNWAHHLQRIIVVRCIWTDIDNIYINMRGLLRLARNFSSKKLGIADTAKVIQEKIMNITQVVPHYLSRMTLRNSALSLALETVLPEL